MSKKLLNSEFLFTINNVSLEVIIDYKNLTYTITEPHQEGCYCGTRNNLQEDLDKVSLLFEVMKFILEQIGEQDYETHG